MLGNNNHAKKPSRTRTRVNYIVVTCFVMFCCFLRVPGISTTPRKNSPLGKSHRMAFNLTWLSLGNVPNFSFFPLFLPSSFQQESFGCDCFCRVLSCFCAGWVVVAATFFFKGFRTSHIPTRIISSLVEIQQNGIQHGSFREVAPTCPNLSCFPLFLPSSFQQEAFGRDCFFHVLSCFCAGWVVGAIFFIRGVPDISHTPRIISSLVEIPQNGIQHGSFREVARACPNLSFFPLFLPSSFQQEAFGCDCFFHVLSCFCAGWVVVAATFFFKGFRTSHIPLE